MQTIMPKAWGAALAGLAGLAVSAIMSGHAPDALAQGKPNAKRAATPAQGQVAYNPDHQSTLRIGQGEALPQIAACAWVATRR